MFFLRLIEMFVVLNKIIILYLYICQVSLLNSVKAEETGTIVINNATLPTYNGNENKLNEIENSIKSKNFYESDRKIISWRIDSSMLQILVRKLYLENKENFHLLNNYAQNSTRAVISLNIMASLFGVMVNEITFNQMCMFYQTLDKKVVNSFDVGLTANHTRYMGSILELRVGATIADHAVRYVNSSLSLEIAKRMLSTVYETSKQVFDNIFRQITNVVNFDRLFDFYKAFKDNLAYMKNVDSEYANYVEMHLKYTVEPKIRALFEIELREALLNQTYNNVLNLCDRIHDASRSIFDSTLQQVIKTAYRTMRFADLTKAMWSHKFISQKAIALLHIFWNLQPVIKDNDQATLLIAHYFRKLIESTEYFTLPDYLISAVESCINEIPSIVKNLYFTQNVYFQNVQNHKMYITPGQRFDKYKHDAEIKSKSEDAEWSVIPVNEFELKFKNKNYQEYLYSSEDKMWAWWKRRVFTWSVLSKVNDDEEKKLTWRVRLENDELIIKNVDYDEYLCVDSGEVVTILDESEGKECRWVVED